MSSALGVCALCVVEYTLKVAHCFMKTLETQGKSSFDSLIDEKGSVLTPLPMRALREGRSDFWYRDSGERLYLQ